MIQQKDLFLLQEEYLKTGSADKFYTSLIKLSSYIVRSKSKITKGGKIDEVAHDMCTMLFEKYITDPDFKVNTSFTSVLYNFMREIIWGYRSKLRDRHETCSDITIMNLIYHHEFKLPKPTDIEEILDHKLGKWILYRLYKNPTVTETVKELTTLGVEKQWIYERAKILFKLKRIMRRGQKVKLLSIKRYSRYSKKNVGSTGSGQLWY